MEAGRYAMAMRSTASAPRSPSGPAQPAGLRLRNHAIGIDAELSHGRGVTRRDGKLNGAWWGEDVARDRRAARGERQEADCTKDAEHWAPQEPENVPVGLTPTLRRTGFPTMRWCAPARNRENADVRRPHRS